MQKNWKNTPLTNKKGISAGRVFRILRRFSNTHILSLRRLIEDITGINRYQIQFSEKKIPLTAITRIIYRYLQILSGKPYAYVVKKKEFIDNYFFVNSRVLIPRPETEELIQNIISGGYINSLDRILDIGTGCGNIAVTIKSKYPGAEVHAWDKYSNVLNIAEKNAVHILGKNHGICFSKIDIIDFAKNDASWPCVFDVIISNPPYIGAGEFACLEKSVRNHEPRTALYGGVLGMDFYISIKNAVPRLLKHGGKLFLEIGHTQHTAVAGLFNFFESNCIILDSYSKKRFFFGLNYAGYA